MLEYVDIPEYGISLPRITSLIGLFTDYKMVNEYAPKSDKAAREGTMIHDSINSINNGKKYSAGEWYSLPEAVRNAVKGYLLWQRDVSFKPKMSEVTVYSLKYGIGGHVDCVGLARGYAVLADWKSGDIHNDRVKMQLAAYGTCYLEMFPRRKIGGFMAVHIDKQKVSYEYYVMPPDEANTHFQKFIQMKREVGIL